MNLGQFYDHFEFHVSLNHGLANLSNLIIYKKEPMKLFSFIVPIIII